MMNRQSLVKLYVTAIMVAATACLVTARWTVPGADVAFINSIAAFLALAVLSEAASLRLANGAGSSVSFIPYLASIVLLGSPWAMLVGGTSQVVAEAVLRRKPLIKLLHNVSKDVLAVGVASFVYVRLGGVPGLASLELRPLAYASAVGAYMLINVGSPAVAISLSSGTPFRATWRQLVGTSLFFDFLASPLALLLAFLYVKFQLWGMIAVIVPLFLIRHVYSVNLQIEQVNRDLLELMVKAIEARDPYTSGHSLRVSRIAGALAHAIRLPARQVDEVGTAAVLHDVGKIYQEYGLLLRKDGRLSPEEAALMRTHPIRSAELVRTISGFRGGVEAAVRHHHENFDGSGYPDGLAGEAIPVAARIIMIADTADAMTTDRPYRAALGYQELIHELDRYSGTQFDPNLVRAFKTSAVIRGLLEAASVTVEPMRPSQVGSRVARLA